MPTSASAGMGASPLRGAGLSCWRIEPLSKAHRLDPDGLPSLAQHCQAGYAGDITKAALPVAVDRGLAEGRHGYVTAIRSARPLDELARCSCTALRSTALRSAPVRCARARSSPRPPAMPGAGPPEARSQLGPARPPRQSLRLVARRPQSRRSSWTWAGRSRQPMRQGYLSHRPRLLGPLSNPCCGRCPMSRLWAHRDPPDRAPVPCEGDLLGDLQCGGPGNRLTVSSVGDRLNSHPTPRPPQGGSEESERRISFQQPKTGSG